MPAPSAVVVALAAPLKVTVAPLPPGAGLIVPEMPNVCGSAVVWLLPLTIPEHPHVSARETKSTAQTRQLTTEHALRIDVRVPVLPGTVVIRELSRD